MSIERLWTPRLLAVGAWRHVITLIAAMAVLAISFVMLQRVIGSASPWLGLLAMFYLLAFAKMAEPLFLLRMPAPLRGVRRWERDGATYGRLRVPAFGRRLRDTPLRYLNLAVYLPDGRMSLEKVSKQAEAAEAAHFIAALVFTPYIGYVWMRGQAWPALLFLLVQMLFNAYPIMHLRIVRGRLEQALQRQRVRHAARTSLGPRP